MLDHFGDISYVTGPDFAENTFNDPDNSADKPVPLLLYSERETRTINKRGKNSPKTHRLSWMSRKGGDQV